MSPLATISVATGLVSCVKPFEVNVNTPEPIKVDLSMDVNVYQHGIADKKEAMELRVNTATANISVEIKNVLGTVKTKNPQR